MTTSVTLAESLSPAQPDPEIKGDDKREEETVKKHRGKDRASTFLAEANFASPVPPEVSFLSRSAATSRAPLLAWEQGTFRRSSPARSAVPNGHEET